MKKTLLAMMLGASVLGCAKAATYDFSYVDGLYDYLGVQQAETYDVAVFLPGDLFEGYHIKEINAKINAQSGVSAYANPTMWLSGSLDLDGNNFTPGIASYPVEIQSDGTIATMLPESYIITAAGVYAGYSITVSKLNSSSKYPMGFDNCNDTNSFFCRTSKSMPQWSNLAKEMGCGAALTVVLESDKVPAHYVSILSMPENIYMEVGKPSEVTIGLSSFATEPVKSIDVEYTVDGNNLSTHLDLQEEVPAGLNKKFNVSIELPAFDHKFSGESKFSVNMVNGQPNESKMKERNALVASFTNLPVHQTLIEEYTGLWCGYCPRGYAALEYIKKNEPDFITAAYHNNSSGPDPMAITTNYPSYVTGFPHVFLDRYYDGDPYYGTGLYGGKLPLVEEVKALNAEVTPWGIEVSHKWEGDDTLVASADVWNLLGFEDEAYQIAYLLVADGLTGTTATWEQTNYYNSERQSDNYIEELNQFCRGGEYGTAKVAGLVFNDVVVSTNGIYGIKGSIPSSLKSEEMASHSLKFDLSKIKATLIPDRNKLRVIAAVLDKNGYVLNCAKDEVNDYVNSAVEEIETSDAPVEYYNLNGMKIADPSNGIFIRRQGTKAEKVIIR